MEKRSKKRKKLKEPQVDIIFEGEGNEGGEKTKQMF